MTTNVCNACRGEYLPVQPDGTRYFHVCPSSVPEADRRDENPPSTAEHHARKIKAEGKGFAPKLP